MEKLLFERPVIKKVSAGMPGKFGMKTGFEVLTTIDGVPIKDLVEKYGSPLYIISEQTIREKFRSTEQIFKSKYPKVQFSWSYKTNYLDAVCKTFHQEGSWAEVVSGFEYAKALKNGVSGREIIFNGPDKSDADLKLAIENESLIHIDHFDEYYSLIEIAKKIGKKARVAIRVNMDTGIYPKWDRFGFNYENGDAWDVLNRIMSIENLELEGLHTHIGTYMLSANAYKVAASKLADLAVNLKSKYNHNIAYIDMGGGFASGNTLKGAYLPGYETIPSMENYADAITSALLSSAINKENMPLLILETGRALIDDAGYLAGTILANKRLSDGRRATVADVGVNLLFTSFWYEHEIMPAQPVSSQTEESTIYGPLCMNIDVLREAINFPIMKKGDLFVIRRIGAYNMTQWMQFITYRPRIVMIDTNGITHVIREKEDLDSIRGPERLPDHLK
ncbi:MAG: alanine racemase [Bacteroidales bacterium]|nr:alanine racemase [Bacteroidales bacterium]MCF8389692.1 alanine racemase [Bacteroidales bacterium]